MANEQLNTQTAVNATSTTTNPATDVRNSNEGSLNAYVTQYANQLGGAVDHSNEINQMYQAQLQGNLAQLQSANQINNANLEANRAEIAKNYQQQMNAAAVDYERNRYNLNQQIANNGLNVGTGSQAALALNSAYQGRQGALGAAQQQAQDNLNRQISNLNIQYQGDIANAIAQNDYQKAAALFADKQQREQQLTSYYQMMTKEANQRAAYGDFSMYGALYGNEAASAAQADWQRERDYEDQQRAYQQQAQQMEMQQSLYKQSLADAQNRASYGDFSGIAQLYGPESAEMARQVWARQNPDIAYGQGAITAQEYQQITGQLPRGYNAGGSGSGAGGNFRDSYYSQKVLGNYINDQMASGVSKADALNNYEARYGAINDVTLGKLGG